MNLRALSSNRHVRRFTIAAVVVVTLVGACVFLRISHPRDLEAYAGMMSECHPVWRQFAIRRFGAGDSAQELLERFPPTRRLEFGRYGVYSYGGGTTGFSYTGVSVVTKDGALLTAQTGGCTWHFTFFSTEDAELESQYAAYMKQKHPEALVVHTNEFGPKDPRRWGLTKWSGP